MSLSPLGGELMSLDKSVLTMGFPGSLTGKESACNAGYPGSIPGWEDPLEKEMATHSSILAWEILWIEEPAGLWSMGSQRVGADSDYSYWWQEQQREFISTYQCISHHTIHFT